MTTGILIFVAVLLLLGAMHYYLRRKVILWRQRESRFDLKTLISEAECPDEFIDREDGTRIRTIVLTPEGVSGLELPTVVLAHSYGLSLIQWNVVCPILVERGFRVIAFDHRGHGKTVTGSNGISSQTMARDIKAVLEHYNVENGILVGHSLGGFLAIKTMLEFPELAQHHLCGVVLLSATAGEGLRGAPQNRLHAPLLRSGLLRLVSSSQTYGGLFAASLLGTSPTAAELDAFNQLFFQHDHVATQPVIHALCHESYYSDLNKISVPCVVMTGTKDKTTPRSHADRLGQQIPNCRQIWIEDKGHLLNWESPESVLEAVQFLSTLHDDISTLSDKGDVVVS